MGEPLPLGKIVGSFEFGVCPFVQATIELQEEVLFVNYGSVAPFCLKGMGAQRELFPGE